MRVTERIRAALVAPTIQRVSSYCNDEDFQEKCNLLGVLDFVLDLEFIWNFTEQFR